MKKVKIAVFASGSGSNFAALAEACKDGRIPAEIVLMVTDKPDAFVNERAKEAVIDAMNGWDPSENAIYYFNPVTATSKWIWSRPQIKKIGLHIFAN